MGTKMRGSFRTVDEVRAKFYQRSARLLALPPGSIIRWRKPATPSEAAESVCRNCRQPIKVLGGDWHDLDGCTNCMENLSAVYTPHEPETEGN